MTQIASLRRFYPIFVSIALMALLATATLPARAHDGHAAKPPAPQAQSGAANSSEKIGYVPKEILERPVTLAEGIGHINDPVTTDSPEAQALYNQGMAYLHSYVWIEAARSFHQALRLDPKLAMAHAGLSRAYLKLNDEDAANAAVKQAQAVAATTNISDRETRRIFIMANQLRSIADSNNKEKFQEYKNILDEALASFPEDPEIWILRGFAEDTSAYGDGQQAGAASIAFHEAALNRAPNHPGALHYLLHSYEVLNRVDKALEYGKLYAEQAPNVPHAVHMYGHNLRRSGRTGEAIAQFERAYELEMAHYKRDNIAPEYDWHHAHNLNLLSTAYQYQGRMKETEKLLKEAIAIPAIGSYQEFFHKDYAEFLLNRGRYEDALEAARVLQDGKYLLTTTAGDALAGNALLALKRAPEARAALLSAEKGLKGLGEDGSWVLPYVNALRGEMWLRSGQRKKGAALLSSVAEEVRSLPGPDAWMQAIFRVELIARIAREAGDWDLAEDAANQMLAHDPYYGGTQYALALVAEHKGDSVKAKALFAKAADAWKKADADLPELEVIRKQSETANAR